MRILFIFLDGVGLGEDNPTINPFALAKMPNIEELLGDHKLIANGYRSGESPASFLVNSKRASLLPLDACLGIEGIPQSATGQASLMTGLNVPARLGFHDGPKPTPFIIDLLNQGTLLTQLRQNGRAVSLLNAYPPRYFEAIEAGYRIPGVIALTANQAGIPLKTMNDLFAGNAISADFTAEGWRSHLGLQETPTINYVQAGERLNNLADLTELTIFEYWLTDMVGHHQDMQTACMILETLDAVIGSVVNSWDHENGLILITSDHGNLEDLSTRHHTRNDVPLLIIGSPELRESFINLLNQVRESKTQFNLSNIAPAIVKFIG